MFYSKKNRSRSIGRVSKLLALIASFFLIFVIVGYMTTVPSANRLSSNMISKWTSDIDGSVFLNLLGMENRALMLQYDEHNQLHRLSKSLFQLVTSIKPQDFRSLLGNELPGISRYDREILIAGEGTDYSNLPVESSFPLEDVLEERKAVYEDKEETEEDEDEDEEARPEAMDLQDAVFIYNTHNREAFLPHLPEVNDPNLAHHGEINITKVSERMKEALAKKGIGAIVDDTDIIGEVLVERGWEYWESYDASREVVAEAFSQYGDLKYAFDIHRDSMPRDVTTKEVNGEIYARIMFVIGQDNPSFKKNFELAESLHKKLEEKYPGVSRGVVPQGGATNNGVYNQDLSENLLVLEIGGVDNTLEETYRTVQALVDVFSEHYWDAEPVQGN